MLLRFLLPVLLHQAQCVRINLLILLHSKHSFRFFSNYIVSICPDKSNTKSAFYKLFILQNLPVH